MQTFKRILILVFVLFLALAALVFILENQESVTLTLFGWQSSPAPLALPVILAFLVGLLLGPVFGWLAYGRLVLRVRSQKRALEKQRRELQGVRAQVPAEPAAQH